MKKIDHVSLADVQAVYAGPEGRLWKLIMGEQIHIGGLQSSGELANQADIRQGSRGVDLCCCNGAGMRFLVRICGVGRMTGVNATPQMIAEGRKLCAQEGFDGRIDFVEAQATATGLPSESVDFVWGEDAWCYVSDKRKLIAEAVRLVRGGEGGQTIAFTDWVEGAGRNGGGGLTDEEAERFMRFMKFPTLETVDGYVGLLRDSGCRVVAAQETGRFAGAMDLYMQMVGQQLTYDVMKVVGFDESVMRWIAAEMAFARQLAHEGKIAQALFVARKP